MVFSRENFDYGRLSVLKLLALLFTVSSPRKLINGAEALSFYETASSFLLAIRKKNPLPTRIKTIEKRTENHDWAGKQVFENINERSSTQ